MKFNKNELVKSPLNYTGGKYKMLPQILPLFPDNIDTFYDIFAGGCNVGVNVKANKIICNDIESNVINLMKYFKENNSNAVLNNIQEKISYYGLSETSKNGYEFYGCTSSKGIASYNKEKYLALRNDFNKNTNNPLMFFVTVLFAFSNQIRFNSKGEFNMPVNKRDFNNNVKKNTVNFIDKLKDIDIDFTNNNFVEINTSNINKNDFVYCDPPYLITCASYNENGGWDEEKEHQLLNLLDDLNSKGIKFAMNNVLENKGKANDILKDWCKKYNVHYLNNSYSNCNYQAKDKSKNNTVEVLITNY